MKWFFFQTRNNSYCDKFYRRKEKKTKKYISCSIFQHQPWFFYLISIFIYIIVIIYHIILSQIFIRDSVRTPIWCMILVHRLQCIQMVIQSVWYVYSNALPCNLWLHFTSHLVHRQRVIRGQTWLHSLNIR